MARWLSVYGLWLAVSALSGCGDSPSVVASRLWTCLSEIKRGGSDAECDCDAMGRLSDRELYQVFHYAYPIEDSATSTGPLVRNTSNYVAGDTGPGWIGGKKIALTINIFDDGTYRAAYNELECDPGHTICGTNDPGVKLGGAWSLRDGKLVLDGLGEGRRTLLTDYGAYPCWPAISFVYAKDLVSPGLAGASETLTPGNAATSTEGLF
jgi:hypothetical protein